jgi:adenylate cyclase
MKPANFTASLNRFYTVVFEAVDSEFGLIDHMVGDGVMAMWIPGFAGYDHPERAVAAGRRVAVDLTSAPGLGDSFPAGVGVHTGIAYVGVVGDPGALDFTVLGDVANTAARLGSAAAGGELVISDDIAKAAHLDTSTLERRLLDLKGKAEEFPVWVETVSKPIASG